MSAAPTPLRGTIRVPGDKSIGHRALILGALCDGLVEVRGVGDGQLDTSVWLKNAFDKDYYLSAFASINGSYTASVGQPRTLGVSLRYDF